MTTRSATTVLGVAVVFLASGCGSSGFHASPLHENGPLYLLRLGPVKEGIYRRDPNGRLTRLTFSSQDHDLSVSPSGDRITFVRNRAFYLIGPDGSDLRKVEDFDPFSGVSWSPAEGEFVYSDISGIWVMRRDGTGKRQLTHAKEGSDQSPAWSPDGRTIVFTRGSHGSSSLFTVHPDGSGLEKLLSPPPSSSGGSSFHVYEVSRPSWSPDGTKIAYVQTDLGRLLQGSAGALEIADRNGKNRYEIARVGDPGHADLSWSPDGKWIVYYDDLRFSTGSRSHFAGIWMVPSGGGRVRQLIPGPWYAEPGWAPAAG